MALNVQKILTKVYKIMTTHYAWEKTVNVLGVQNEKFLATWKWEALPKFYTKNKGKSNPYRENHNLQNIGNI